MHLEEKEGYDAFKVPDIKDLNSKYSFSHLSDKEIWAKFKSGNEGAFIYIYEHFFDKLVNFSYQFTSDIELIKDTVQDLFIYIRNKRSNLASTDNIKLYLYKCCRNNLLSSLKMRLKHGKAVELEENFFQPIQSEEENIIKLQTQSLNAKTIKIALEKLSSREREIIYYFYFEDLPYKDIAELLEYKEIKSVRSLLYKAVNKLRGLLITLVSLLFFLS